MIPILLVLLKCHAHDTAVIQGAGHPAEVGAGCAAVGAGTEFSVEPLGDGVLLWPLKATAHSRLEDVVGCLRIAGRARTFEEMDAAIVAGLRRRRGRGRY